MELEGTLRAFSLPDVLQFLSMGKMTGTLNVWQEGYNIDLIIKDGKIVNSSTLDRPRKLGQMLVYRGFIKRSDLEEALGAQKGVERGKMLGEILIERDLITKKTLKDALKLQLEEQIWELFFWRDGNFKFEHSKTSGTSEILIEIDIESLLIEGSRRLDEWAKIAKNIPRDDVVLTARKPEDFLMGELTLSESEWYVLSFVNGLYDVGSIIDRSGLGKFETYRILNSFLTPDLVEVKPAGAIEAAITCKAATGGAIASLKSLNPPGTLSTEGTKAARPAHRGLGSLFYKNKPTKDLPAIQLDFVSPVGALAFFVNSLYETLITADGFASDKAETDLLSTLWRQILMQYPKADLICVTRDRLNVRAIEAIIEAENGITNIIHDCFEDSLEAIVTLTSHLHQRAVEQLGEKSASRMASGILADFGANIHFKHKEAFELRSWARDLLKIRRGDS